MIEDKNKEITTFILHAIEVISLSILKDDYEVKEVEDIFYQAQSYLNDRN